jgi:hypothetical protein
MCINMNLSNLKIGDLIIREKGPFSTHFMVYIGMENGNHIVAENQNGFGVRYVNLVEGLNDNSIKRFEKFGGTENERDFVIPRINNLLGKDYDLIAFNCEHFARLISNGKTESRQVKLTNNLTMLVGTAMLTSKSETVKSIGAASIILGLISHTLQQ